MPPIATSPRSSAQAEGHDPHPDLDPSLASSSSMGSNYGAPSRPSRLAKLGLAESHSKDDDDDEDSVVTDNSNATELAQNTEREVSYGTGVTALFKAIEDGEWELAMQECDHHPGDVRVWVKSTGTENTVFNWSVWRRLPIHEACRRQPPPILIAKLLQIFPDSSTATTHFGELPLHLAVGCGASPAIVNLLLASHFTGIVACDNGGRSPLEIMHENGDLRKDSFLVAQALSRGTIMYERYEQEWETRIRKLQREHEMTLVQVGREHEFALAEKDSRINDLTKDISKAMQVSRDLTAQIDEFEEKVTNKNNSERKLMEHIRELEDEIAMLRKQNRSIRMTVSELEETKVQNEKSIQKLKDREATLSKDLTTIVSEQDRIVDKAMSRAEADLKSMMESQKVFMRKVAKHREGVRSKTRERGIALPLERRSTNYKESLKASTVTSSSTTTLPDKTSKEVDPNIAATAAAAAAAVAALELSGKEGGSGGGGGAAKGGMEGSNGGNEVVNTMSPKNGGGGTHQSSGGGTSEMGGGPTGPPSPKGSNVPATAE